MQNPALRRLPLLLAAAFASEWIYAADAAQDAEQVQLEEVVVTGERTNRSGFETATSNRVFTTPNIDRSGHNLSATDLLKQTVNTVDLGSGNDLPTVRGVDGSRVPVDRGPRRLRRRRGCPRHRRRRHRPQPAAQELRAGGTGLSAASTTSLGAAATARSADVGHPGPTGSRGRTDPRTSLLLILVISILVMAPGGAVFIPAGAALGLLLALADGARKHAAALALGTGILGFGWCALPRLLPSMLTTAIGLAANYFLRFLVIYGVGQHLFRTATPGTMTAALRAARVPRALTVPVAVMLRFVPVVAAEASAVLDSMRLRGLTGWRSVLRHPVLSIGWFTVPVIASTLRVGDDLSAAALLRGLGSHRRPTCRVPLHLGRSDLLWIGIGAVLVAACPVVKGLT